MAKAKEIKPHMHKAANGGWSATACLRKPNGKFYTITFVAAPDMKMAQGKSLAIERLDQMLKRYSNEHPDWVRVSWEDAYPLL